MAPTVPNTRGASGGWIAITNPDSSTPTKPSPNGIAGEARRSGSVVLVRMRPLESMTKSSRCAVSTSPPSKVATNATLASA